MRSTWLTDLESTLSELRIRAASTHPDDVSAVDHLITRLTRSIDGLAALSEAERSAMASAIPALMNTLTATAETLTAEADGARDKLQAMRLRLQAARSYKQPGK